MLKRLIIVLILGLPVACLAQAEAAADSLYSYTQSNNILQFIRLSATQLQSSTLQKAGVAGISYRQATGSYRVAQEAQKSTSTSFNTDGLNTLGRFKLHGFFNFSRTKDDSLSFNMKGIKDSPQPLYFMAKKASNYERQTYNGGGIISYALLKDKMFLSTGVDYFYNSSAGSVDPRAIVYTYRIKFSPELTYKLGSNFLGLGLLTGYGDEDVQKMKFKNENYAGLPTDALRIPYINYGYGFYQISTTAFKRKNKFSGLNASYAGMLKSWSVNAKLAYEVNEESNQNELDKNVNNTTISVFQLETTRFDLLLTKRGTFGSHQLKVQFEQQSGNDNLNQQRARNFTYESRNGVIFYSWLNNKAVNHQFDWSAGLNYLYNSKRDATSSHQLVYNTLEPQLGHSQYWHNHAKDLISAGLQFSARIPFDMQLNVPPTQVTVFSKGVVFPDYLYWSAKAARASFRFNYVTERVVKKFKTGFGLESSYLKPLNTVADVYNATFVPKQGYLDLKLSLNLYL
ncbi:DUF6850 family outer membrane beta-barrel protein [Pedobacter duraquae]|uniref:DUF6850 domain-containing protein n=1 Tax=Pedobacter duraquae TaxID=425511 RepID=A0A4R6IRJ8_9SPHI|nr:DUF6850 family outer membrane beta-barrel protein [Pedobacter duraquae]TDO24495.1 hypothetical protein CLV32_0784 [Pedobacter duraquae]